VGVGILRNRFVENISGDPSTGDKDFAKEIWENQDNNEINVKED
jgi:hypothetical protein